MQPMLRPLGDYDTDYTLSVEGSSVSRRGRSPQRFGGLGREKHYALFAGSLYRRIALVVMRVSPRQEWNSCQSRTQEPSTIAGWVTLPMYLYPCFYGQQYANVVLDVVLQILDALPLSTAEDCGQLPKLSRAA
jgi:hypothetical protein